MWKTRYSLCFLLYFACSTINPVKGMLTYSQYVDNRVKIFVKRADNRPRGDRFSQEASAFLRANEPRRPRESGHQTEEQLGDPVEQPHHGRSRFANQRLRASHRITRRPQASMRNVRVLHPVASAFSRDSRRAASSTISSPSGARETVRRRLQRMRVGLSTPGSSTRERQRRRPGRPYRAESWSPPLRIPPSPRRSSEVSMSQGPSPMDARSQPRTASSMSQGMVPSEERSLQSLTTMQSHDLASESGTAGAVVGESMHPEQRQPSANIFEGSRAPSNVPSLSASRIAETRRQGFTPRQASPRGPR